VLKVSGHPPEARMRLVKEDDDLVLCVEVKEGRRWTRIAKRYSGKNWISVEPGYTVRGSEPGGDYKSIEIDYSAARAQAQ
jgi:hypothetical protein